jgi:hypothetical protein
MQQTALAAMLSLSLLCLGGDAALSQDGPVVDPTQPLFNSHQLLELTLEADFDQLKRDRSQESEERPAKISFNQPDGTMLTLDIQLRTRGRLRLKRDVCNFPPLRVNFRKRDVQQTVFAGQDKLKLVVQCQDRRPEYEQYVLREYLAYRVYNMFTELSFRVRLARITYVQSVTADSLTRFAFLIEDEDNLARRNGAIAVDSIGVHQTDLDEATGTLLEVFQYFIGNTDWKTSAGHNVQMLVRAGDPFPIAVPFDFDGSGAVNAGYVAPDRDLGTKSVTQRSYIGACRTAYDLESTLNSFRERKDDIYALYSGLDGLSEASLDHSLEYFEQFYRILDDPLAVRRVFVRSCPVG